MLCWPNSLPVSLLAVSGAGMAKGIFLIRTRCVVVFLKPLVVVIAPAATVDSGIAVAVVVPRFVATLVVLVIETDILLLNPIFGTWGSLWFVIFVRFVGLLLTFIILFLVTPVEGSNLQTVKMPIMVIFHFSPVGPTLTVVLDTHHETSIKFQNDCLFIFLRFYCMSRPGEITHIQICFDECNLWICREVCEVPLVMTLIL